MHTTSKYGLRDILPLIAIIGMSFLLVISASHVFEYTFQGTVSTGSVDVDITPYEIRDGELVPAVDKIIMPGDRVSYIPEVRNLREPGYVRMKAEITMDEISTEPITLDNVLELNDDWVRKGEHFYCTRILERGEKSNVFNGLSVPKLWTEDTASGFTIKLVADVIQSANFKPDFNSDSPWGSIEIENAKESDQTKYHVVRQMADSNTLEFRSGKGFEANAENLFKNFKSHMSGDKFSDYLNIRNNSEKDIELFFKTDNVTSDILQQMKLTIRLDGKHVYYGNLESKSLSNWTKIMRLKSGKTVKMEYTVELPSGSVNCYSVLNDKVKWQFKCAEIDNSIVKTGDETSMLIWLALFIFSIVVLVYLGTERSKDESSQNL